jgi:hypothetical protein
MTYHVALYFAPLLQSMNLRIKKNRLWIGKEATYVLYRFKKYGVLKWITYWILGRFTDWLSVYLKTLPQIQTFYTVKWYGKLERGGRGRSNLRWSNSFSSITNSPPFREYESSFHCSQYPTTGPYPEIHQYSPHYKHIKRKIHFNIIPVMDLPSRLFDLN